MYHPQDIDYFRNFRIDTFYVDWNNEIGIAPEYLYEISQSAESEYKVEVTNRVGQRELLWRFTEKDE